MSVFRNQDRHDRSNTRVEGDRVVRYAKDDRHHSYDCIDYGAIALRREVIASLPLGKSDLADVQTQLAAAGNLRAYVTQERFYEIGSPTGLAELDRLLAGTA